MLYFYNFDPDSAPAARSAEGARIRVCAYPFPKETDRVNLRTLCALRTAPPDATRQRGSTFYYPDSSTVGDSDKLAPTRFALRAAARSADKRIASVCLNFLWTRILPPLREAQRGRESASARIRFQRKRIASVCLNFLRDFFPLCALRRGGENPRPRVPVSFGNGSRLGEFV